MEEIYKHKDFNKYEDKIGIFFTPYEFIGEYRLNKDSFKIKTLLTFFSAAATLKGEILTIAFLTPLEKVGSKQKYKLEWGIVKKD